MTNATATKLQATLEAKRAQLATARYLGQTEWHVLAAWQDNIDRLERKLAKSKKGT